METEKGLENRIGENNCFLNVIIQSLWHLESFKRQFIQCEEHNHKTSDDCIFCALKIIFNQYNFGEEEIIPPLHEALSHVFAKQLRFQMNELGDAAEAFEKILESIHLAIRGRENCEPPCFVHENFGLTIVEQQNCSLKSCQATSEPVVMNVFMLYILTSVLRNIGKFDSDVPFDQLIKISTEKDKKKCINKSCASMCSTENFLFSLPKVFTI